MKKLLILLVLLAPAAWAQQEAALEFEQSNQLYRAGEYRKAAQLYEQVLKNGYEHPALYYNLGNAYFKAQNIPAAILAYERARRLAPDDEDIQYNLRIANVRVVDKIDPLPELFFIQWWRAFLALFPSGGWAAAGIVSLWLAVIAGALFMLIRSALAQRLALSACVLCILLAALSFVCMAEQLKAESSDRAAIIFAQSLPVKSAPDQQSVDLFVIHEGLKVQLLDSVGDWRKIRLADGKVGWAPAETMQAI